MDRFEGEGLEASVERLSRENRRWKWAVVFSLAALLLVLSSRTRTAEAQAERPGRATILKFGEVFVNTFHIARVQFPSRPGDESTFIYFAGGVPEPLKLSKSDGEKMRPWLEGHSIDLTTDPRELEAPGKKAGVPIK